MQETAAIKSIRSVSYASQSPLLVEDELSRSSRSAVDAISD